VATPRTQRNPPKHRPADKKKKKLHGGRSSLTVKVSTPSTCLQLSIVVNRLLRNVCHGRASKEVTSERSCWVRERQIGMETHKTDTRRQMRESDFDTVIKRKIDTLACVRFDSACQRAWYLDEAPSKPRRHGRVAWSWWTSTDLIES
jgi:hypothetical protein